MLVHVLDIHHTCTGFFLRGHCCLRRKEKNAGTMSRLDFRKWTFVVAFCWSIWLNTQNVLMYFNSLTALYICGAFFFFSSSLFLFAFCTFCVKFIKYWITPCAVRVCESESEGGAGVVGFGGHL